MNTRIIRIAGMAFAGLGFILALGAATFDIFTGGGQVGDSQVGAFFISVTILLFGLLLIIVANNIHLKERVKAFENLHDSVKAEPHGVFLKTPKLGFIYKRFNIIGLLVTLVGLALMAILILKDYDPPLSFDIGSVQLLAIFGGSSISILGLGIMTLDTAVMANSMTPLVSQLGPLLAGPDDKTPPGRPIKVKGVVRKRVPAMTSDVMEPAVTVEVIPEQEEPEVEAAPEHIPAIEAQAHVEEETGEISTDEAQVEETAPDEMALDHEVAEEEGTPVEEGSLDIEEAAEAVADELFAEAEREFGIETEEDRPADALSPEAEALASVGEGSEEAIAQPPTEVYECPNCLNAVAESDTSCPNCGAVFVSDEEVKTEEQMEVETQYPEETVQEEDVVEDLRHDIDEEISGPPGPGDLLTIPSPAEPEPEPEPEPTVTASDKPASANILESILTEIQRLDTEEEPIVEEEEAAEVPTSCPNCGRKLKPRWRSCPFCGLEFR